MSLVIRLTKPLPCLFAGALAFVVGAANGMAQQAEPSRLPTPNITIYPGDVVRAEWLTERDFGSAVRSRGRVVESQSQIVGKIARRTLLPGVVIPLNAIGERKLVANGAKVAVLFERGALTIATYGAALQDGAAGDVISLRNLETGAIITGVIQADGSVRVQGG